MLDDAETRLSDLSYDSTLAQIGNMNENTAETLENLQQLHKATEAAVEREDLNMTEIAANFAERMHNIEIYREQTKDLYTIIFNAKRQISARLTKINEKLFELHRQLSALFDNVNVERKAAIDRISIEYRNLQQERQRNKMIILSTDVVQRRIDRFNVIVDFATEKEDMHDVMIEFYGTSNGFDYTSIDEVKNMLRAKLDNLGAENNDQLIEAKVQLNEIDEKLQEMPVHIRQHCQKHADKIGELEHEQNVLNFEMMLEDEFTQILNVYENKHDKRNNVFLTLLNNLVTAFNINYSFDKYKSNVDKEVIPKENGFTDHKIHNVDQANTKDENTRGDKQNKNYRTHKRRASQHQHKKEDD